MKPTTILFLFLLIALASQAQRGVRLTSRISKRQKFFLEGSRVVYQYANNDHPLSISYSRYGHPIYTGVTGVGILKIVNDSTIQVDQETIKTKDLILFGQRNKGAWVGAAVLVTGGLALMIASKSKDPDTQQVTINAPLLTLGVSSYLIGLIDSFSRTPKTMNVWRVDVVK